MDDDGLDEIPYWIANNLKQKRYENRKRKSKAKKRTVR